MYRTYVSTAVSNSTRSGYLCKPGRYGLEGTSTECRRQCRFVFDFAKDDLLDEFGVEIIPYRKLERTSSFVQLKSRDDQTLNKNSIAAIFRQLVILHAVICNSWAMRFSGHPVRERIQGAGIAEWNANRARIFIATLVGFEK